MSVTEDVTPLSRPSVRSQLVAGLSALPVLGEHVRSHDDRWPVRDVPGVRLSLDLRSEVLVRIARLSVEKGGPRDERPVDGLATSVSVSIPWAMARAIGQASSATRRMRIFRSRLYWALEAQRDDTYLAEQRQVDIFLAHKVELSQLIRTAAVKAARFHSP